LEESYQSQMPVHRMETEAAHRGTGGERIIRRKTLEAYREEDEVICQGSVHKPDNAFGVETLKGLKGVQSTEAKNAANAEKSIAARTEKG